MYFIGPNLSAQQIAAELELQPDDVHDMILQLRTSLVIKLIGNTFDAVLSRLAGQPASDSRFLEEIGVLTLASLLTLVSPFLVLAHGLMSRLKPTRASRPL